MAMAQGWSSLSADLVNCVADRLLATSDLDCYTALRAVCHHWRSFTTDPRSNQHDPRFRPSRWVMLEEPTDGTFLFVNTATGRFLRRSLPLLRDRDSDYIFVTSTVDGLLVLAAREPPHAVSVLNPFTGSLIRFVAPAPVQPWLIADVVGSSPTLFLVSVVGGWVYRAAKPRSESFYIESHDECPASRLPQIAAAGVRLPPAPILKSVRRAQNNLDPFLAEYKGCRYYAVVAAGGNMLAVLKWRRGVHVFRIDDAGNMNVMEGLNSIGSQALFLGVRCLVVDTDCFPTVEANCAYFQLADRNLDRSYIYKFIIGRNYCHEGEEPELVSAAMGNMRPSTLTQLLCNYTMDIPVSGHLLTWGKRFSNLELDCLDYIDYVDDSDEYYEY